MHNMTSNHEAENKSQLTDSSLALCVQPVHLFVWMIEYNCDLSFAPSHIIFINSSVCLRSASLSSLRSFFWFLPLSVTRYLLFSHHFRRLSVQTSSWTEYANISLLISGSLNYCWVHSLWAQKVHFQNYKVEKQRTNSADFRDKKHIKKASSKSQPGVSEDAGPSPLFLVANIWYIFI